MNTLDVEAMLLEIDPAAPCGPNLEYDPTFLELEQEALGKPEVQYGATLTSAIPPDWKIVRRIATELLERSRDLRLAVHLLRANLALSGIAGLADSLALIERLLDTRWDSVYPQLDADDDNDPSQRINCLAVLADAGTLVRELKEAPLLVLPGLGPLTIKLLEVANGELPPPAGQDRLTLGTLEQAIGDVDPGLLAVATDALARALASVVNIELTLVRQVGSSQALNLDPLTRPLRKAHDFLAHRVNATQAAVADDTPGLEANTVMNAAPTARAAIQGDIVSRDDVLRTLDKLIGYYARNEPSSPIPILLARAKRLVSMNFFEIMHDLAPEGVAQLEVIRGPDGAKEKEAY